MATKTKRAAVKPRQKTPRVVWAYDLASGNEAFYVAGKLSAGFDTVYRGDAAQYSNAAGVLTVTFVDVSLGDRKDWPKTLRELKPFVLL